MAATILLLVIATELFILCCDAESIKRHHVGLKIFLNKRFEELKELMKE